MCSVFHVCEGSPSLTIVSDGLCSTFKTLAFHLHTMLFLVVGSVVPHMKVAGWILLSVSSVQVLHLHPTLHDTHLRLNGLEV